MVTKVDLEPWNRVLSLLARGYQVTSKAKAALSGGFCFDFTKHAHEAGDNLLSPKGVPSTQEGLTAVFGMRTGMALPINHQLHARVYVLHEYAKYFTNVRQ
jgi:hypothetical protein